MVYQANPSFVTWKKEEKKENEKKRMKTESESFGQNNTSYSIYIKKNYLYSILSNQ